MATELVSETQHLITNLDFLQSKPCHCCNVLL